MMARPPRSVHPKEGTREGEGMALRHRCRWPISKDGRSADVGAAAPCDPASAPLKAIRRPAMQGPARTSSAEK